MIQHICHLQLFGWKHMGIMICNILTLVADAVADGDGRKTHVNQKRDMGVSQIMDTDPLDSSLLRSPVHLTPQKALTYPENPVFLMIAPVTG